MGAILANSGDSDSGPVYFPFGTSTQLLLSGPAAKLLTGEGRNDQDSTTSASSLSWQDIYVTTY